MGFFGVDRKKISVDAMENGEKGFVDLQLKDFAVRLIPCFLVVGINMKSKESQGETAALTIFLLGTLEKQQRFCKIILVSEGGQNYGKSVCMCVCSSDF